MKKKRLIYLSLILCLSISFASAQQAVISSVNTRVLYLGMDNIISVAVPSYAAGQIILKTDHAELIDNKDHFIIRFDKAEKDIRECIIQVFIKEADGSESYLEKQSFSVLPIPLPDVMLNGNIRSGRVGIEKLKTVVRLELISCLIWHGRETLFELSAYNFIYHPFNGLSRSVQYLQSELVPEQLQLMHNAKKGDVFIFSEIEIKIPNGETIILPDSLIIEVIR